MSERIPPYSEEAERGVLGAALLDGSRVTSSAFSAGLTADAFYVPAHRTVWEAVTARAQVGNGSVDILLVTEALRNKNRLEEVGGQGFLDRLVDGTPTAAHAEYYIDIVRQKWIARMAIQHALEIADAGYHAESGDGLIQDAVSRFTGLVGQQDVRRLTTAERLARLMQKWQDAHDGKGAAIGLETPWDALTEMLCGVEVGVTLLAARPSMGKTTMEDQIANHVASLGIPVGRITLDSTTDELLARTCARSAGVSLPKLKFGYAGETNLARVRDAQATIQGLPIFFDDESRDIRAICAKARAWKIQHDIGLLTLDYVQLVQAGELWSGTSDNSKVAYVSAQLKALALGLRLPLLELSQLSRPPKEKGKVLKRRPSLEDLRDSGALEQDAHKVIMLYQDHEWCMEAEKNHPGATRHKRAQWADVLKHKDGETGRIPMWLYPHYFRFEEANEEFTGGMSFDRAGDPVAEAEQPPDEPEAAPEAVAIEPEPELDLRPPGEEQDT
jgi:replicative DNA helicase